MLFVVLLLATTLFARAGGGQGYSGGGGGGGNGGGGGGDFGDLLFLIIRLMIYYPKIGIPAAIIVIAIVIYMQRTGVQAYQGNVLRRGHRALSSQQHASMINRLRMNDPAFDEQVFAARVTEGFHKIQSAWSSQDLRPARPFVSDAVFERFSLQFDEQRALGYRNVTDNVIVHDVSVAHVQSDRFFDTIAMRISAQASDHNVSLADGSRIAGSNHSGPFVEIWSFLRRRSAKTVPSKPGLIEGNCPNCGAAIEMNQNAGCDHCGALLRSGEYDWVLAEITQECEWSADASLRQVPGVGEMMSRDPTFNLQDLEDRASVMFWRRAAAERTGDIRPLRKIAAEEFVRATEATLRATSPAGGRRYYGECAVGSVQTIGLMTGDEWDRAMVEVRWSGTGFVVGGRNQAPTRTSDTNLSRTVFELSRRAGVRSDVNQAISSAHCPGCGAPEKGGASNACEFCGMTLNDGRHGWVLTAVRTVPEARQILAEATPGEGETIERLDGEAGSPTAAGVLAWMASVAVVDGHVDEKERQLLTRVADRRHVPAERVEALLSAASRNELDLAMPHDVQQSRQWLGAMASAALVDGNLSRDEYSLLRHTGARLGLSDYDVRMLVKRTRADAYDRAKLALREARRSST